MRSSVSLAAMIAAALSMHSPHTTGPQPKKFRPLNPAYVPTCGKECYLAPETLEDGREIKTIHHAHNCPAGLAAFNQTVDNRQVRRNYARIMKKRGAA